ncbi:MAG: putative collagen-binding domain-containing protein, partial [Bryobacteraceae bacterium]
LSGADHIAATRGDGYVFVYSAQGRAIALNPLPFPRARAWWYNPRSGAAEPAGELDTSQPLTMKCPSEGFGSDWVLVLDDASRRFPPPGAPLR